MSLGVKIYTKTGDKGETGLWGGDRVQKSDPHVCAYGDVDELNCAVGAAIAALGKNESLSKLSENLLRVQGELLLVGGLVATPEKRRGKLAPPFDKGLPAAAVTRLEAEIDAMTGELAALTSFILPGGAPASAALHVARTVCRRAERGVVALAASARLPENVLIYLNRLSDHLFTAARWVNVKLDVPETPWRELKAK